MSDKDVKFLPGVEDLLEDLGYTDEQIEDLKAKVLETLATPEFQQLLPEGLDTVSITLIDDFDSIVVDENGEFDWAGMSPDVKAAMEELYYSPNPPTIH
jgi:hypothetical protein